MPHPEMIMTHRALHRKRVLWIKADPLYPLDSGGKIRTFQMLKEWHRQHDITYLALFPTGMPEAAKTHALSYSTRQAWVNWVDQPRGTVQFYFSLLKNLLFSRNPYVIDKYRSAAAESRIIELEKSNPFDIVVVDFLSMSLNINTKIIEPSKVIVFQHNVESQIWKRHYETANNLFVKAYMYVQWRRYRRFEAEICSICKGVIAVSEDDAARFQREFGLTNIIGHVPTGVDIEFFSGAEREPERQHLMFLGSMDWMPNIDGIIDFVRTVYPKIKAQCPSVRLTIIGRNPAKNIRALSDQDDSISITGTVDDVRPYMEKASVSVVPLRVGGGTRIKIFETMAMGIPVVSSSIGAEGLPVHDGHNIYIADDPDTFAERVLTLLEDAKTARAMGLAGQQMVRQKFTWYTAVSKFDEMCGRAIANSGLTTA